MHLPLGMTSTIFIREIVFRKILHVKQFSTAFCHYQSVDLELRRTENNHNIAILKLNNPAVNSLNLPLIAEFSQKLENINNSKDINGILIASTLPSTFSAGIELNEFYQTTKERLTEFWSLLQETWLQVYSSPHPIVAAINGHCLAGGTMLAAASDYRIALSGDYKMGVTAARIGVFAPPWFQQTLKQVIGHRNTELMLSQARVFSPHDALKINLVDEVYDGDLDLLSYCITALQPYMEVFAPSRALMKLALRQDLIKQFERQKEEDTKNFVSFVLKPSVQQRLGEFIKELKTK